MQVSEAEKNGAIIERDGFHYIKLGTGHTFLISAHFDEGWVPPPRDVV